MNDEVTYIGTFNEEEIERKSSKKSSKDNSQLKFKTKKYSRKISKFISSTKNKILNRKIIFILVIILLIYFLKPITFLRAKLDEKREFYSQFETVTGKGIIDSIMYGFGAEYYKNCRYTMVSPADGLITCQYDLSHKGIDIACDEYHGNIYAAANGYVSYIGYSEKYGNEILIEHNINGMKIYTYYAHLLDISVSDGQYVYQNQIIGHEGGNPERKIGIMDSDGHYVHFEVRKSEKNGTGLNPLIFIDN